jgi:flagellar protein FliO/FliZ
MNNFINYCILSTLVLLGNANASDVKVADEVKSELLGPTSMSNSISQMALGLLVVLAIIFLLAWLMRRVTGVQNTKGHIKILSAVNVGTRERAVLIEVGEEQLLLGVAAGQVNLLHKLSHPVAETSTVDFSTSLQNAVVNLKRKSKSESTELHNR